MNFAEAVALSVGILAIVLGTINMFRQDYDTFLRSQGFMAVLFGVVIVVVTCCLLEVKK